MTDESPTSSGGRPPGKRMAMLSWVTAGQLDAGLASLATFAAAFFAVSRFEPATLGFYALAFAAFQVVNQVSTQMVFLPTRVISLEVQGTDRLGYTLVSLRRGAVVAAVVSFGVWLGTLPAIGDVAATQARYIIVTGVAVAFISPIQDHLRRSMHLSGISWIATLMSATQLVGALTGLAVLARIDDALAPFGALVIANVASASVGIAVLLYRRIAPARVPEVSELKSLGGWLLLQGLSGTIFTYLAATTLKIVAGTEALGFVEGVRVAAQPLNVMALGLMAIIGPRSMEAASERAPNRAATLHRNYLALYFAVAIPYALIVAFDNPLNLLHGRLENAYAVGGLITAMLIARMLIASTRPMRTQLVGARLQRYFAIATVVAGVAQLVTVAITAGLIDEFAAPLGWAIGAVVIGVLMRVRLVRWYREEPVPVSP